MKTSPLDNGPIFIDYIDVVRPIRKQSAEDKARMKQYSESLTKAAKESGVKFILCRHHDRG